MLCSASLIPRPPTWPGNEARYTACAAWEESVRVCMKQRVLCAGDTASWVEVYVQSRRQWKSVHLPSLSVGQPQLCEKHCSQPLNYIIGIENGTHADTCIHMTSLVTMTTVEPRPQQQKKNRVSAVFAVFL